MDSTIQDDLSSLDEVSQSKFCVKCGADLQGCVLFCPSCGKSIVHPTYDPDRVPRKKISGKAKRRLIRAGIGALVVAILLVIFVFNGRALSPQGAVDNYIDILNGDLHKIRFSAPPDSWLTAADQKYDTVDNVLTSAKEEVQKNIDTLRQVYGPYTITGRIVSEEDVPEYKLEALHRSIDGWVNAGKKLQVQLTITGLYGSSTTTINATAVRIGLHWYLII